jgi:hypothetical protein
VELFLCNDPLNEYTYTSGISFVRIKRVWKLRLNQEWGTDDWILRDPILEFGANEINIYDAEDFITSLKKFTYPMIMKVFHGEILFSYKMKSKPTQTQSCSSTVSCLVARCLRG